MIVYLIAICAGIIIWHPARKVIGRQFAWLFAIMTGFATIYGGSKTATVFKLSVEDVTATNIVLRCEANTNLVGETVCYQLWNPSVTNYSDLAVFELSDTNVVNTLLGCFVDSGSNRNIRAYIEGRPE